MYVGGECFITETGKREGCDDVDVNPRSQAQGLAPNSPHVDFSEDDLCHRIWNFLLDIILQAIFEGRIEEASLERIKQAIIASLCMVLALFIKKVTTHLRQGFVQWWGEQLVPWFQRKKRAARGARFVPGGFMLAEEAEVLLGAIPPGGAAIRLNYQVRQPIQQEMEHNYANRQYY